MTTRLFSELGISPEVLKAIDKLGYEQASPIQAETIPLLLSGRDVVGQSQTGSGKTAAFAVPAIEKVDSAQRQVQVLVLCPTRELAVQVAEEIYKLAAFKRGVQSLPIYGGQSYERQYEGLRYGPQIVIGTPGRVMDHMRRGTLRLDKVKMMVLDEADVMLDMGFREDIELILESVPAERQTVFFCATLPRPIQDLIQRFARQPQHVRIEQKTVTVPTVEQVYYEIDRRFKIELLTRLIDIHDFKLGIIFCNTKAMVDDLADHLNAQGYSADRLHGDMSQAMRDRVMHKFRKSGLEFLVATDVAARGIDVDDVQVVFNYDLPYDVEDYVHRIGRTGRAGRSGRAISFVAGRELFQINQIERYTRMKIKRAKVPTPAEVEEARANVFLNKIRAILQNGEYKRQDHLIERLLEEGFSSTDVASAILHFMQTDNAAPEAQPAREESRSRDRLPSYDERHDRRRPERPARPAREDRPLRPKMSSDRPVKEARSASIPMAPSASKAPAPATPGISAMSPAPAVRVTSSPASDSSVSDLTPAPAPPAPLRPNPPLAKAPPRPTLEPSSPKPARPSRRTPDDKTRLYMNVGEQMGIAPADVVNAIQGETGLPAQIVGSVDIRDRHLFVDVASEHANAIISKLNRARIKNNKVKVKVA